MKSDKPQKSQGTYSRREFLQGISWGFGAILASPIWPGFSALATGTRDAGIIRELPREEKLGIALVGLGSYSTYQLAPALQQTKLCKLSGIVTGTPAKEKRWASKYDIPERNIYNYETYDQISRQSRHRYHLCCSAQRDARRIYRPRSTGRQACD